MVFAAVLCDTVPLLRERHPDYLSEWAPHIHYLLYADDTALTAPTTKQMHRVLRCLEEAAASYGLSLRYKKDSLDGFDLAEFSPR